MCMAWDRLNRTTFMRFQFLLECARPRLAKRPTNFRFLSRCRRSEFLGCMSFPVRSVQSKEVNGSFKLQPRSCLTIPAPPIAMGEAGQSSLDDAISSNNDEAVLGIGSVSEPIPLSKKAMHQRDADENLFLRFLELDPPPSEPAAKESSTDLRRKSTHKSSSSKESKESTPNVAPANANGRTPFTITKKLPRTADRGFGFSIVWTHPPRIEKVEPGLSADKCGILPGDYVIFVDKHNVVTMPELDILNLIKSQGKMLVLEIFRRNRPASNGIKSRVPSLTSAVINMNSSSYNNNIVIDDQTSEFATPKQSSSSLVARPATACSNVSLETTKKRLNLPQVTFSKEVGQGVVV